MSVTEAREKIRVKEQERLKSNCDRAQRAIRVAYKKAKNELYRKGVDARKAER
jgi:hypothetical protein